MDKLSDNGVGAFLAGCVFVSGIVFLIVIYNNIKNAEQEFCNIFYAEDLEFKRIRYDTITPERGILKFSENGNTRVISVDSGYSILCYKENK